MQKWYIIEDNIGSGKSTLLNILKDKDDTEVIEEPLDVWLNIKDNSGINLLQHFYSDMIRYSYMFQTMVFKTRLEALDRPQIKSMRFSERSIWSDKYIFGKICIADKKMTSIEAESYTHWFDWLSEKFKPTPDGIIYVQCTPEKCMERIDKRHRSEESKISWEYINQLHAYHEDWFSKWTLTPLLILDNSIDDNWDDLLKQIDEFKCIT